HKFDACRIAKMVKCCIIPCSMTYRPEREERRQFKSTHPGEILQDMSFSCSAERRPLKGLDGCEKGKLIGNGCIIGMQFPR
ncbi:MAG: hypothetical protein LUD78_02030, partial [Clostridiales bacterium]|nr:hypothetical protein [Clostridiales bacterium]